jgi:hypothetical protein
VEYATPSLYNCSRYRTGGGWSNICVGSCHGSCHSSCHGSRGWR